MNNPFEKRATEYISDPLSLLPLVNHYLIELFFEPERGALFDKLTMWAGSPGSGKTTVARILEFDSLRVLGSLDAEVNKELSALMQRLGVLHDGVPTRLVHRLAMSINFRSIWELPYSQAIREALLRAFVQSKAVLGWIRKLEKAGVVLHNVEILLKEDSESASNLMSASDINMFRDFARKVELDVFKIVTALIPPTEEEISGQYLNYRYDIFDYLRAFKVAKGDLCGKEVELKPMIIVDDAHDLHPDQFKYLNEWLKSREIGVSRWVMCRVDAVPPADYRGAIEYESDHALASGTTVGRDYYVKLMQLQSRHAKRFRKVACNVAERYLRSLPEYARRSSINLPAALGGARPSLSAGQLNKLRRLVSDRANEGRISSSRQEVLDQKVSHISFEDEKLAALRILVNREINNTPQMDFLGQPEADHDGDSDGNSKVKPSVVEGGRIQMMHEFERPLYFGIDRISDASNANIEQFISLAGPIVSELIVRIVRGKPPSLPASSQHLALKNRAEEIMRAWDFPYHAQVAGLVEWISSQCLEKTLLPHAPLDSGANAVGVLQHDMDKAMRKSELLAKVLHFAFAYKALVMVPGYNCKGKVWCLLELGGIPIINAGLTLNRGGFVEKKVSDIELVLGI